ncbi:unnamed protein product [Penicillium salamii]|uniref:Flavoprotein oxygenase n=1 Tax=Penicillium salamii TaxID=1612424 RepID=A0A9W4NN11_9EURO|nr:unnamed protein product [Penicillium salamii]CAG8050664.1 unnamed protein product [Penicillium salamii]CAG8164634.1 unnamed protein product [Penicillium salamii]CAG8177355.1 unnamed protein product [Penicillium salamii]CAG8207346.1 unnamed protein product [Penicillium salamii]
MIDLTVRCPEQRAVSNLSTSTFSCLGLQLKPSPHHIPVNPQSFMARLNDDNSDAAVESTEILSPQPFHPQSKDFLVSLEPGQLYSTQMPSHEYEYNSSSSSARHSTSDVFGREMDEELDQLKSRASSRSSVSSIPASVLIHPVEKMKQMPDMDVHEKIAGYRAEESEANFGDFSEVPTANRTIRQREAVFRKPSSVRALQMHTEDEADEDDYLTPPRRRAGIRSPGSAPAKRSPYYSPKAQRQPTPKREAPLVLLHCTLLPPSIPVPGAAEPRNQDILEDELPAEYWKRWRRLQDRVGSGVLRDRGVLISHPEDLYDMLEERLLESLELQRPRLQNGHFVGREDQDDSGDDFSDIDESETDGEQGEECPDCGNHVRHSDSNRKWEIRVFAANGLMRAGAWAAAWRDMEKVDVEVGLWLPSDVRRGLERRFAEEQMALVERDQAQSPAMQMLPISSLVDRENQILPEILQSPRRSHAGMVSDVGSFQSRTVMPSRESISGPSVEPDHHVQSQRVERNHEVALSTLCANYIRVLAADRRNIALVLLSMLVAFLAFGYGQRQPFSPEIQSYQPVSYDTPLPSIMPSLSVASASLSPSPTAEPVNPAEEADPTPSAEIGTEAQETHDGPLNLLKDVETAAVESEKVVETSPPPKVLETSQSEDIIEEVSHDSAVVDSHLEDEEPENQEHLDGLDESDEREPSDSNGPSGPHSAGIDEDSEFRHTPEASSLPVEPTDTSLIVETEETPQAEPDLGAAEGSAEAEEAEDDAEEVDEDAEEEDFEAQETD